MKAYSLDLRQRVVAAYEKGKSSIVEVAEQFNVGQTFVKSCSASNESKARLLRSHTAQVANLLSPKKNTACCARL